MEQIRVNSRVIKSMFYDYARNELTLNFRNGKVRRLADVPVAQVEGLAKARSPGDYYLVNLRGKYPTAERNALPLEHYVPKVRKSLRQLRDNVLGRFA